MSDERAVTRPVVNVNEPLPDDPGVADRWALICGESLTDLMPSDERGEAWRAVPGGSPFNTALALARLGMPTSLLQPGFPRRPGQTGDRTVGAGGGGPELCAAHIAANDDWSHEEPPARKEVGRPPAVVHVDHWRASSSPQGSCRRATSGSTTSRRACDGRPSPGIGLHQTRLPTADTGCARERADWCRQALRESKVRGRICYVCLHVCD